MAILVLGISVAYGNDRYLLLDSQIIDNAENAQLTISKVQIQFEFKDTTIYSFSFIE
jgi:hypothetical protein